jgi:hypothetical protein
MRLVSRTLLRALVVSIRESSTVPGGRRLPRGRTAGRSKRRTARHRGHEPFYCLMILLHTILERLGVPDAYIPDQVERGFQSVPSSATCIKLAIVAFSQVEGGDGGSTGDIRVQDQGARPARPLALWTRSRGPDELPQNLCNTL